MKRSLKNGIGRFAIRSLSSMLPVKIMDLIVSELLAKDRLVSRHGFYYLTNLAEKLNVVALSVRGDYGTFVGAPNANVKSHQLALFDRKAKLPFEIAEENLGDHRIHIETGLVAKQGEIGRKVIDVCAVPLDDLHLRIKGPLLIKIDTQGAEPFVFSGGKATLSKADLIVVEWSPYHMARVGGDPMVVINFLQREFSFVKIIATDVSQRDILPTGGEKQMFDS